MKRERWYRKFQAQEELLGCYWCPSVQYSTVQYLSSHEAAISMACRVGYIRLYGGTLQDRRLEAFDGTHGGKNTSKLVLEGLGRAVSRRNETTVAAGVQWRWQC